MTASASPVAPVTARSPRSMIAAFSRAIAAIVGPSRSVWSRSTFVIAATPPSQAWVASSRPPRPDLDEREVDAAPRRTSGRRRAVRSSNSVGGRRAGAATRSAAAGPRRRAGRTSPRRSAGRRSGAARGSETRCGFGVSPTRRPAARSAGPARARTLPLPFVPATSAPRKRELRIAERAQERPGPAQPEPDRRTDRARRALRARRVPSGRVLVGVSVRLANVTRGSARPRRRRTG